MERQEKNEYQSQRAHRPAEFRCRTQTGNRHAAETKQSLW
jgi:hypothetical protein